MPLSDGEVISGYTISRMLGSGGMGEVYLAHDAQRDRDVALMLLHHARRSARTTADGTLVPLAEQEAYREASRPVEWHATSDKYHTSLKVTFHHDSAEQDGIQVQQLRERRRARALRLQRPCAALARVQRHLALGREAAHQDGDMQVGKRAVHARLREAHLHAADAVNSPSTKGATIAQVRPLAEPG